MPTICHSGGRVIDEAAFRPGLDPLLPHRQVSARRFFNVSNRATLSRIFGRDIGAPQERSDLRESIVEMTLSFVTA